MISDPAVTLPRDRGGLDAPVDGEKPRSGVDARRRAFPRRVVLATGLILLGTAPVAWWYGWARRPAVALHTIESWIKNEQYGLAQKTLTEHLRHDPGDGAARMMLARVLGGRGDLAGCARELHQVPAGWPQKPLALYREAQADLLMNRARDAEAALRAIIDADGGTPSDPAVFHDASQELLSLYATEDRWSEARDVLWKVYARATPHYRPTLLAMRILYELERLAPTESVKLLRNYVSADREDWEARRALAKAELALGRRSEALRQLRDCLEARPDDPRVWRDYLNMLYSLGERDAYEAVLARAPAIAETRPELWVARGQAREHAGDWTAAAADYRRALTLDPNLSNAHYRLAAIELRLGHSVAAAEHRRRWQELEEARSALRPAFDAYVEAQRRLPNDHPELLASLKRLAAICQTLGWSRTAAGWSQLAAS